MTIDDILAFKRGSILEYEKLLNKKQKANNKLKNILRKIYELEDEISVFESNSLAVRYVTSKNKLYDLYQKQNKLQDDIKNINNELSKFI